ncbi:chorismate mutase [Streptomyces uncialis]|uniref:chorismate mutase n=1 Tax=Streptomyces uncialis TaxID=1048205 RepID=UPI0037F50252
MITDATGHPGPRRRAALLAAATGSLTLLALAPLPALAHGGAPATTEVTKALSVAGVAAMDPGTTAGTAAARNPAGNPLRPVTALLAERLLVADKVAAAKYGTALPIEDISRERQILDDVAGRSVAMGLDPVNTTAVFRDQIEAGKAVQRALFARWDAHPRERPTERPDLAREVRPVLDRVTTQLLEALRESRPAREAASCRVAVRVSAGGQAYVSRLDRLHTVQLFRGLRSVCTG